MLFYKNTLSDDYTEINTIIENVNSKTQKLLKYKIEDFSLFCINDDEDEDEHGEIRYNQWENKEATSYITAILAYIKEFDGTSFSSYPTALIKNLNGYLSETDKFFTEIKDKKNDESTLKKLEKLYTLMQEKGGRYLIWNDLLNKQQELEKIISDFWNIKNPAMQTLENSWNENIKKAEELKASEATVHHANNFNEQSKYHSRQSKYWLIASITILVAIFSVGLYFLLNPPIAGTTDNLFIYIATSKIVLFVVLFYALSVCMKNYKAHQHNMLINKHRYNALCTYDYFIGEGNDNETKKSMLIAVFNTIFINQSTSYETDYSSPKEIIEPLKDFISKKG